MAELVNLLKIKIMANKLDLADAQLTGFKYGKWQRSDVVGLIEAMGLTKKEWQELISKYEVNLTLDEEDFKEVNAFFGLG